MATHDPRPSAGDSGPAIIFWPTDLRLQDCSPGLLLGWRQAGATCISAVLPLEGRTPSEAEQAATGALHGWPSPWKLVAPIVLPGPVCTPDSYEPAIVGVWLGDSQAGPEPFSARSMAAEFPLALGRATGVPPTSDAGLPIVISGMRTAGSRSHVIAYSAHQLHGRMPFIRACLHEAFVSGSTEAPEGEAAGPRAALATHLTDKVFEPRPPRDPASGALSPMLPLLALSLSLHQYIARGSAAQATAGEESSPGAVERLVFQLLLLWHTACEYLLRFLSMGPSPPLLFPRSPSYVHYRPQEDGIHTWTEPKHPIRTAAAPSGAARPASGDRSPDDVHAGGPASGAWPSPNNWRVPLTPRSLLTSARLVSLWLERSMSWTEQLLSDMSCARRLLAERGPGQARILSIGQVLASSMSICLMDALLAFTLDIVFGWLAGRWLLAHSDAVVHHLYSFFVEYGDRRIESAILWLMSARPGGIKVDPYISHAIGQICLAILGLWRPVQMSLLSRLPQLLAGVGAFPLPLSLLVSLSADFVSLLLTAHIGLVFAAFRTAHAAILTLAPGILRLALGLPYWNSRRQQYDQLSPGPGLSTWLVAMALSAGIVAIGPVVAAYYLGASLAAGLLILIPVLVQLVVHSLLSGGTSTGGLRFASGLQHLLGGGHCFGTVSVVPLNGSTGNCRYSGLTLARRGLVAGLLSHGSPFSQRPDAYRTLVARELRLVMALDAGATASGGPVVDADGEAGAARHPAPGFWEALGSVARNLALGRRTFMVGHDRLSHIRLRLFSIRQGRPVTVTGAHPGSEPAFSPANSPAAYRAQIRRDLAMAAAPVPVTARNIQ
ncbi:hypothetical protein H696_00982 [Fonticula alba]|uniref:Uncharacterized protein n=1 Tax=Fonticula alba TaxID=691883 RepID=A0A058ZHM7_FONAL|nr:hypothetical protein H696_00982 [Fonticula alba]KCV73448.1 hypothetical protein H696_00982 [Fonticula alba]|eukprot:XP_009493149.1 hypothetical protein H696_00982 [Fonticula alba]